MFQLQFSFLILVGSLPIRKVWKDKNVGGEKHKTTMMLRETFYVFESAYSHPKHIKTPQLFAAARS